MDCESDYVFDLNKSGGKNDEQNICRASLPIRFFYFVRLLCKTFSCRVWDGVVLCVYGIMLTDSCW